jgi:cold-inducible RNA-binding protein
MPFGEVLSVTMMDDKYIGSGQMRGYGFVEIASKSEAQSAISNLTGKVIKGRAINVVEALPLSNTGNIHSRMASCFSRNDRVRSC